MKINEIEFFDVHMSDSGCTLKTSEEKYHRDILSQESLTFRVEYREKWVD